MADTPATDPDGLEAVLAAVLAGDPAAAVRLVDRHGAAIERELVARGTSRTDARRLVHEVAVSLIGRPSASIASAVAEAIAGDGSGPLPTPGDGPRALHLVDIENLSGGPRATAGWFTTSLREFAAVAEVGETDQVVMAADRGVFARTAFGVDRRVRYRFGTGPDGADHALLDAAPTDWVVDRFDRLVVGSGDHIFADLVADVGRRGCDTVVVARPAQLAGRLRRAAAAVRELPDLPALAA